MEINEWYEENSFSANLTTLENKLLSIENNFHPIDLRIKTKESRDLKIEEFESQLASILSEGKKLLTYKPWTEEFYEKNFTKEIDIVKNWFNEKLENQKKLELYEESDFTEISIEDNIIRMRKVLNEMNKIKKPRPPPIDTTKLDPEEVKELIRNGTLELEEFLKGRNDAENNNDNANEDGK